MRRYLMPKTDLWAAPICLGTVNFTTECEKSAFDQIDCFVGLGGNLLDTANIYGQKHTGDENRSEQVIGHWLQARGNPEDILIVTKGGHPWLEDMKRPRLDPASLAADLDASRKSLGRDVIDLYFLHRDDPDQPVAQMMENLEALRSKGHIRWYGLSNWRADRIAEAAEWSKQHNGGLRSVQNRWSLAQFNPDGSPDLTMAAVDADTVKLVRRHDLTLMAYAAMAKGFFTKLSPGTDIQTLPDKVRRYFINDINLKRAEAVWKIAAHRAVAPSEIVLAWLLNQNMPVYPVVSFSSLRQIEEAMSAAAIVLSQEEMAALSAGSVF